MSAVLDTPNLRQRQSLRACNAARAEAIRTSERRALRVAEQEWRAQPVPVPVHRTRRAPTPWQRTRATLVAEFGRRWWLALIGAALYFGGGSAAWALVLAVQAGWWQP